MNIEINVTKVVKYVCVTGAVIVAIIFGQKTYAEYIHAKNREEQ